MRKSGSSPRNQAPPSDKNRVAQSAHPTLDRKTLRQLEAMQTSRPAHTGRSAPSCPAARSAARSAPSNRHRLDRRLHHPRRLPAIAAQ